MRFFVTVLVLSFIISPAVVDAFGVSPPFITASKLVAGSRYETTITLVQGQPNVDLEVKAVFDVPEKVREWFSVDKGNLFTIPAGVQQFPIKVAIQVPIDAGLGIYNGYLRINTVPQRKEGEQIAISVGARIDINLTVGDDIVVDFSVKKIDILDIRENESPRITVTIENAGNVPVALDRATFDLLDKYGEVRLGFAQTEDLPETPAFEMKTFTVEFPLDIALGIGEYWAEARLYKGNTVIKQTKTVFNVTPAANHIWYVLIGGVVLLIGAVVFIFAKKSISVRKKRKPLKKPRKIKKRVKKSVKTEKKEPKKRSVEAKKTIRKKKQKSS